MENARPFKLFLFQASVQEMDTYNKVVIIYSHLTHKLVLSRGRLNISKAESECTRVCNVDFKDVLTKLLSNNQAEF